MRKWPIGVLLLALVLGLAHPGVAAAEDIALKKIMRNAAYGGMLGALVGGALLAFTDDPGDHLNFVTTGAAAGILVGAAWGVYDSSTDNPYVYLEDGRLHAALPPPRLAVRRASGVDTTRREALVTARLVGVRF
jgi:hypothetical protein